MVLTERERASELEAKADAAIRNSSKIEEQKVSLNREGKILEGRIISIDRLF